MTNGLYLYCIVESEESNTLGNIGLYDKSVYAINYKDIGAIVSSIPFKEIQPNVKEINWHQQVVEVSRGKWPTLPVRFGTMFKSAENLMKYLEKSYKDLRPKVTAFRNKDEYGVKVIFDKDDLSKLDLKFDETPEIKRIKNEMETAGKGTSYFLKLKMDEAIKIHALKKIDQLSGNIHSELDKISDKNCALGADLSQIILNTSYLVDRDKSEHFANTVLDLKEKYSKYGLMIHMSGPWAPYSFC